MEIALHKRKAKPLDTVAVEGRDWVLKNTQIEPDILKRIYKGPTQCWLAANRIDSDKANVFAEGKIVGFLSKDSFQKLAKYFESDTERLEYVLRSPHPSFPMLSVQVAKPQVLEKTTSQKGVPPSSPLTPRSSPKQKHPISGKAFMPKQDVDRFFSTLLNVTGIYCIYSNDFATYIGQSESVGKRLKQHISTLRQGKHPNLHLQHAWNTKGERKFTFHLVEKCSVTNLDKLERFYIEKYGTYKFGYNATPDGQGLAGGGGSLNPVGIGTPLALEGEKADTNQSLQKKALLDNESTEVQVSDKTQQSDLVEQVVGLDEFGREIRQKISYYSGEVNGIKSPERLIRPKDECNISSGASSSDNLDVAGNQPSAPLPKLDEAQSKSDATTLKRLTKAIGKLESALMSTKSRAGLGLASIKFFETIGIDNVLLKKLRGELGSIYERLNRSKRLLCTDDYNSLKARLSVISDELMMKLPFD